MIAPVAPSQFRMSERIRKRTMRLPVALAILFSAFAGHLCYSASDREYELIPGPDGLDLSRGNKRCW